MLVLKEKFNEYYSSKKGSFTHNARVSIRTASSIKHHPGSKRYYFDVGLGSVCLAGADTGGAYCLLEVSLAPGIGVPRHTHTREDETYYVTSGELEVKVGDEIFVLKPGDTLLAPRNIPHELRNSGNTTNHYLLVFSPSGFEEFIVATALPAPDNAVAPTERQLQVGDPSVAVQNVHKLANDYGILFGWLVARSILASLFLLHGAIGDRVSNAVACIIALISTRNLLAVVTVTVAFALLREATVGESRQGAVLSETLLRTGSSWDGEPYKSYLSGLPELTILKITLAPHTKLEWHSHPMPNAAYPWEKKRGKKQHFAAGQAVSETVDTPHRGITGDEPVIVIVFYAGISGTPLNSPAPLHQS